MTNIKLQSSDGKIFDVDVSIVNCSSTIKTILEDLGMEEGVEETIPVFNVNSSILAKVIDWATYHKDDIPSDDKTNKPVEGWDAEFLKVDQATLFELIMAANYLDIKGLLDITCQAVADLIKGKTPEEMRQLFIIN